MISPEERLTLEKLDFVERVKVGVPRVHAALEIGWSLRKLDRLMRERDFASAVEEAEAFEIATVEKVLRDKAVEDRNMEAIKMILFNRAGDRWAERKEINVQTRSEVLVAHVDATREALLSVLEDPEQRAIAIAALSPGGVIDVEEIDIDDD